MLTLRRAAALLARCDSLAAARTLLEPLGFTAALPISDTLRRELAIDSRCGATELLAAAGALRALLLEVDDGGALPELLAATIRRLQSRAPHVLWVVLVCQRTPARLGIAVPRTHPARGMAALVVDRTRVVDSDAETLTALAAAPDAGAPDLTIHGRWVEILGRDALNRRFYRALEAAVRALAEDARGGRTPEARADVALLCSSRLLFLAFLQGKGWLDGDRGFLARIFDRCMRDGGDFHRRMLRPLFFGTLNTGWRSRAPAARAFGAIPFLNGGLFAPAAAERGTRTPVLSDEALGRFLHDVLGGYRFTAREDRTTYADTAIDPEMLGRAFESLMASRERRASGSFYTPSHFAARVVDHALLEALAGLLPARAAGAVSSLADGVAPEPAHRAPLRQALGGLTVLDPACGSGTLLLHALERLAAWVRLTSDRRAPGAIRRDLLARNVFGIDRNPMAVWLCELRLWLAIMVDDEETDPRRVVPLPNLDRNVRVGDALLAPLAARQVAAGDAARARQGADAFAVLRSRYARATGARKQTLGRALDRAERAAALAHVEQDLARTTAERRDIIAARRGRDLFGGRYEDLHLSREAARLRGRAAALRRERTRLSGGGGVPFRYDAHFADSMASGGFAAVIGNPPWVRLHRIPPAERSALRAQFAVLRDAAWLEGAVASGAGRAFAGQADLAALFVERSLDLLREGGVLGLLLPAKLWTALAGGGARRMLHARAHILSVEDCSDAPELFDAVTYPSILVAERACRAEEGVGPGVGGRRTADDARTSSGGRHGETRFVVHRGRQVATWTAPADSIRLDESSGSPWLLLPPVVRCAFERLRRAGTPLGAAGLGRLVMGVKCGLNEAFLVHVEKRGAAGGRLLVRDRTGRRTALDATWIRPVLRGEDVRRWRSQAPTTWMVWTHDAQGPLRVLPPHLASWLAPHRNALASRTDLHGRRCWWALHRVEGAHHDVARVVWADLTRSPRALWIPAGDPLVPLNTCYVLRCPDERDAQAITTLLNSPVAAAWLRCIAEPARGGYRRLLAWTVAMLPLPSDWHSAREILAPVALRATSDATPASNEILDATLAAYRVRRADIEPLLEWHRPDFP